MMQSTILLTGGTGSFGTAFIRHLLSNKKFKGIIRVFSRDEYKQYQLQQKYQNDSRIRFLIGDVRDKNRLFRAMDNADIVIHAAALKQIVTAEYNPFEVIKTNILGSQNVVEAAIDAGVNKAILISSDKAVQPINLYGATKMVAERVFIQGNVYSGRQKTIFSAVRYGNVLGSRGSVVPLFLKQKKTDTLTITHQDMTRFWITLPQACQLVFKTITKMKGGEIFVPKLPSVKITDLAKAIAPKAKIKIIGIRPGEKLHEDLLSTQEWPHTKEYSDHFVIYTQNELMPSNLAEYVAKQLSGKKRKFFSYQSNSNTKWLRPAAIRKAIFTSQE